MENALAAGFNRSVQKQTDSYGFKDMKLTNLSRQITIDMQTILPYRPCGKKNA